MAVSVGVAVAVSVAETVGVIAADDVVTGIDVGLAVGVMVGVAVSAAAPSRDEEHPTSRNPSAVHTVSAPRWTWFKGLVCILLQFHTVAHRF